MSSAAVVIGALRANELCGLVRGGWEVGGKVGGEVGVGDIDRTYV